MRSFRNFLWVAAAAMLAACSNDVVLRENVQTQTDASKAIGFSSYSESITRGDVDVKTNLEYYHFTFAVYGTKKSVNDNKVQYVFGGAPVAADANSNSDAVLNPDGTTCTYQEEEPDPILGDWAYTDPRFWDKQANYNFIAYAPVSENNPIRYYYKTVGAEVGATGNEFKTSEDYTLTGTNLQATATEAEIVKGFTVSEEEAGDLDLMISNNNKQNGAGHDDEVKLVFRHILSKLNVTFKKGENLANSDVTVTEVTIAGLDNIGTYAESDYVYSEDAKHTGWTASTAESDEEVYALEYGGENVSQKLDAKYYFIESLVIPQEIEEEQVTLTAKYTIKTGNYSEDYVYTLDLYEVEALRSFFDGFNYTLNFTINPDVIKFDATVKTWDNVAAVDRTIPEPEPEPAEGD